MNTLGNNRAAVYGGASSSYQTTPTQNNAEEVIRTPETPTLSECSQSTGSNFESLPNNRNVNEQKPITTATQEETVLEELRDGQKIIDQYQGRHTQENIANNPRLTIPNILSTCFNTLGQKFTSLTRTQTHTTRASNTSYTESRESDKNLACKRICGGISFFLLAGIVTGGVLNGLKISPKTVNGWQARDLLPKGKINYRSVEYGSKKTAPYNIQQKNVERFEAAVRSWAKQAPSPWQENDAESRFNQSINQKPLAPELGAVMFKYQEKMALYKAIIENIPPYFNIDRALAQEYFKTDRSNKLLFPAAKPEKPTQTKKLREVLDPNQKENAKKAIVIDDVSLFDPTIYQRERRKTFDIPPVPLLSEFPASTFKRVFNVNQDPIVPEFVLSVPVAEEIMHKSHPIMKILALKNAEWQIKMPLSLLCMPINDCQPFINDSIDYQLGNITGCLTEINVNLLADQLMFDLKGLADHFSQCKLPDLDSLADDFFTTEALNFSKKWSAYPELNEIRNSFIKNSTNFFKEVKSIIAQNNLTNFEFDEDRPLYKLAVLIQTIQDKHDMQEAYHILKPIAERYEARIRASVPIIVPSTIFGLISLCIFSFLF
jgi:hypothetical protein